MRCNICSNYMSQLDSCKYCRFEYDEKYTSDDWDILDQDFEDEIHKLIQYRLQAKGIECIVADIYWDMDIAFLIGCYGNTGKIAQALGVHDEVVYGNNEQGLIIINLFKEKYLRLK